MWQQLVLILTTSLTLASFTLIDAAFLSTSTSINSNSQSNPSTKYYHRLHSHSIQVPSWDEIETNLNPSLTYPQPSTTIDSSSDKTPPKYSDTKPTLFRERHGWCPYSERVWLALEIKNVQYDTIYIDNSGYGGRPSYFSGSTPQIKWAEKDGGRFQGESMDLVRAIDTKFKSDSTIITTTNELYPTDIQNDVINKIRAFETIFPKRTRPSSRAAFLFKYDGEPLWKNEFEKVLCETNELLKETSNDGPFFCGHRLTAADIAWAPFLERYAAQLPCLHSGLNPRYDAKTYPYLVAWYDAMDAQIPEYVCKVKGDASSWRKVLTMAGFGNAGVPMDVTERMEDFQENESRPLTREESQSQQDLWDQYTSSRPWVGKSPSIEAASVMTRNRIAIMKDIKKNGAKNNASSLVVDNDHVLDEAMRAMVYLLSQEDDDEKGLTLEKDTHENVKTLAAFLDYRMCVPRDMSCLSAATIKRLIHK